MFMMKEGIVVGDISISPHIPHDSEKWLWRIVGAFIHVVRSSAEIVI